MAEVKLPTTWHLNLDGVEMRLVLRALGGRITDPQEIAAAKALGDQITIARANVAENLARGMRKNSDHVDA